MRTVTWNPEVYGRYSGERSRPFVDLVSRVATEDPTRVADLGCGSGTLTAMLGERWPDASVSGFDSSPEMVAQAPTDLPGNVTVELGDIMSFDATGYDVVVSNAALQWVPSHRELIDQWTDTLESGSWLAWQVPGNFDAPSHALMRDLAESAEWSERLGGVLRGLKASTVQFSTRSVSKNTDSTSTPGRRRTYTCWQVPTRCSDGTGDGFTARARRSRRS